METIDNEDFGSQLRALRFLLGEKYRRISAETLAAMVHISPASLRGVEAGRRRLNQEDRNQIATYAGAVWNEDTRQWACSRDKTIPFHRAEYLDHAAQLDSGRRMVPGNQIALEAALDYLVNNLSAREANIAMLKLRQEMVAIARENNMSQDGIEFLESCGILQKKGRS